MELDELSLEELTQLKKAVEQKIQERETAKQEFKFEFEATGDPRKGTPYVAQLSIQNGKLERTFVDLARQAGRHEVTVSGSFWGKVGEVYEKREAASWKNDYRYWYVVSPAGEMVRVASIRDSNNKMKVMKYLSGTVSLSELLGEDE